MALEAQFDAGFGAETRYLRIRAWHVDLDTGAITHGKLEIYKDKATRQAYKSARQAIADLTREIAMREAAFQQIVAEHRELPTSKRLAAEGVHQADKMARAEAIEALKAQSHEQVQRREANKPGRIIDFEVQPGEVQIGPDGEVLTVLYGLYAVRFPDAERVD